MKLELFMFDTCPFCRRVLNYIDESGRTDVELHNIRKNEADRQRLIAAIQDVLHLLDPPARQVILDAIEEYKKNGSLRAFGAGEDRPSSWGEDVEDRRVA